MNRVAIRLIGAPLLLAALGACLYVDWKRTGKSLSPIAIPVILCFFSTWSFHEICAMGRLKGLRPYEWIGWILLPIPYAAAIFGPRYGVQVSLLDWQGSNWLLGYLAVTGVAMGMSLVAQAARNSPRDSLFTLFSVCYMHMLSCTLFLAGSPGFLWWLLFLLAAGKGSDMAAYSVGKLIGRHKMAPCISPNKTWEGAIAGLIAGSALGWWVLSSSGIGFLLVLYSLDPQTGTRSPCAEVRVFRWYYLLPMATIVCVASQLGDLAKSALKRWAGVKDSGKLLPEFGGTLDMVDSFVLGAPAALVTYHIAEVLARHGC